MRRVPWTCLLSALAWAAACSTELRVEGGGRVVPDADAVDASGTTDAFVLDSSDGGDGRGRCVAAARCQGAPILDEPFSEFPAGAWNAELNGVVLDKGVFVTPPSSMRAIAEQGGAGGRIVTTRPASGRHLCIEMCALIEYDNAQFGDGGTDYVQLFAIDFRNGAAGELREGSFNFGVTRVEYAFNDGDGGFNVPQFDAGVFPRGRWAHFRIDLDYAATPAPRFEWAIDGVTALEGPLSGVAPFTSIAVGIGAGASGVHSKVDARFDDLRITP